MFEHVIERIERNLIRETFENLNNNFDLINNIFSLLSFSVVRKLIKFVLLLFVSSEWLIGCLRFWKDSMLDFTDTISVG